MSDNSTIEWTDAKMTRGGPVWTGEVRLVPELLDQPLRWKKPRRIFVNSMSDLFHEDVPDEFILSVWRTMANASQHTFQILTKRPTRMRDWLRKGLMIGDFIAPPLDNVWLGVSTEDQATADERIPLLLQTLAAVRWISAEPLLSPIDLTSIKRTQAEGYMRPLDGRFNKLGWIVAGGESGPKARPSHPDWFRSLRNQCAAMGVPFFFKQWGEWGPPVAEGDVPPGALEGRLYKVGKNAAGRRLDGVEHNEYPA